MRHFFYQNNQAEYSSCSKREIEIYSRQLEHALDDGVITKKEEKGLAALREDLGIPEEVHDGLLAEMTRKGEE